MNVVESARGVVSRSRGMTRIAVQLYGRAHGFGVKFSESRISITAADQRRRILLNPDHAVYARDVLDDFDIYFNAVEPGSTGQFLTVDYSARKLHAIRGWDVMPIEFPSLAEPLVTARQYLDFAHLEHGQTVMDLGAYSGFTSVLFQEAVGPQGRVLAVEADPLNTSSLRRNIDTFRDRTGGTAPEIAEVAVWSHDQGIEFLSEGNMGSAAVSLMKRGNRNVRRVPSTTLSKLAEQFDFQEVHFIKADIEGAEFAAFSDRAFFQRHHPRIIFEGAGGGKDRNPRAVVGLLEEYGYRCQLHDQIGSRQPLVECV